MYYVGKRMKFIDAKVNCIYIENTLMRKLVIKYILRMEDVVQIYVV
jgi:hypothetical protein